MTMLAAGPARATQIMSRLGLRKFPAHRHRFGRAQNDGATDEDQYQRQQDGAERIDMLKRVECDAAHHPGRVVAKVPRGITVGGFVEGDSKDHG